MVHGYSFVFFVCVGALLLCRPFTQNEQHLSIGSFNYSEVVRFHASRAALPWLLAMGVLRHGRSRVVSMAQKDHTVLWRIVFHA
jgi:hypothetical protein